MGKSKRGKGIKNLPNRGRGECPHCKHTGVKLLWNRKEAGGTIKVCKRCRDNDKKKGGK